MSTPETTELELIALSHDTNIDVLQHDYREMRGLLDNRLGGMALEAVNDSEAAVVNRNFLEAFVGILPRIGDSDGHNYGFNVDSQADVRWLQNSVLYWGEYSKSAYYILGSLAKGDTTELLLHRALTNPEAHPYLMHTQRNATSVVIAEMDTDTYRQMRGSTAANLHKPLSSEEMNKMFDRRSKKYVVKDDDSAMVATTYMTSKSVGDRVFRVLSTIFEPSFRKRRTIAINANVSAAVYGDTLDVLGVAKQISYLALAFEKEEELREVIKKYVTGEDDNQLALFE